MTVGTICNRNVLTIRQNQDLDDAIALMRSEHVGDVVVVEERNHHRYPIGILTDRDILLKILAQRLAISDVDISDVMSFDLVTALDTEPLIEALERMRNYGVRRLPVVNRENHLIGILTLDDVVERIARKLSLVSDIIRNEQSIEEQRIRGE